MTHEEILKRFKRFLKEHGVYKTALSYYLKFNGIKNSNDFISLFKKNHIRACDLISDSYMFCVWDKTKEKRSFWCRINILWKSTCIIEKICLSDYELRYTVGSYQDILNFTSKQKALLNLNDEEKKIIMEAISITNAKVDKNKQIKI